MSKETFVLWAIGGAFKRDICEKLCNKYQLKLLSLDAMIDREKNDEASKSKEDIKNHGGIFINLLKDAIQSKQDQPTAAGYVIESATNHELLTQFEKTVLPIKKVLYFKSSDKILKDEILEQLTSNPTIDENSGLNENKPIKEETHSIKKCLKKTATIQEKAVRKLDFFNENLVKIEATYKDNFKVINGKINVEGSYFNNAVIFLDEVLKIPKEEVVTKGRKSKK